MSENYSIRSFGYTVIPQEKREYAGKKVEQAIDNLLEPVLSYLEKNENVFSGDVATEIEKANIQTMQLGMAMRKNQVKHSFDITG